MIFIDNLKASYSSQKEVLKGVNLRCDSGLIHGIVGLNGAGKTTLLNTMFGLKKSDEGTICYNNKQLGKRNTAFLMTENYFYSNITAREYLSLFSNPSFDTEQWCQLLQLPQHEIVDTFSTGMKKKLAFLGILKQDKEIMILDEPFNGLDLETCRVLHSVLTQLRTKGKTIFITSHILETLTNLCDHIHHLENGSIKHSYPKEEFDAFQSLLFQEIEEKNGNVIEELVG